MTEIKLDLSKIIKQVSELEQRISTLVQNMPGFARAIDNVGTATARADDMLTRRGSQEANKITGNIVNQYGQPVSQSTGQPKFTGPNTVQAFDQTTLNELKNVSKTSAELVKVMQEVLNTTKMQVGGAKEQTGVFKQLTNVLRGEGFGPKNEGAGVYSQVAESLMSKAPGLAKMGIIGGAIALGGKAVDLGLGITNAYMGGQIALGQATYKAPFERQLAEGDIAQREFARRIGSMDATNAENLIKYRADLLNPNENFRFLGTRGFGRAFGDAGKIQGKELELEKKQAELAQINFAAGSAKNIGSEVLKYGAGGLAAGAAIGSVVPVVGTALGGAIGGIAGAAFGLFSGGTNVAAESTGFIAGQAQNRSMAASGELDKGMVGLAGRLTYGDQWEQIAKDKQAAVIAQLKLGRTDMANELVQSELKKNREKEIGVQGQLDMVAAQKEGVISVGRNAMTRKDIERMLLGSSGVSFGSTPEMDTENAIGDASERIFGKRGRARSGPRVSENLLNSITSNLEMAPSEFMMKANQLTGALGAGERGGMGGTADMIRLGRSGLGDYGQLLGNLGQMNQVAGGQDNTSKLRDVLTSAVSIGFDKSRLAQSFVSTTTSLAQSLGTTNVGAVGESLALRAQALGGGKADERSMSEAARGMQALDQATKGLQGVTGVTKMASIFGAGARVGTGAGILSHMSSTQLANALREIDQPGKVNDPNLRDLLNMSGGDRGAVKRMLEATYQGVNKPLLGIMNMVTRGDKTFEQKLQGLSTIKDEKDKFKQYSVLLSEAREAGEGTGVGGAAAQALVAQEAEKSKVFTRPGDAERMLKRVQDEANAKFKDPAAQNMRKYIDNLIVGQVRGETYDREKYISTLGRKDINVEPISLEGNIPKGYGRQLTAENIRKAEEAQKGDNREESAAGAKYLEIADKQLKGAGFDIARSASLQMQSNDQSQAVKVTNIYEFVIGMAQIMSQGGDIVRKPLGTPGK